MGPGPVEETGVTSTLDRIASREARVVVLGQGYVGLVVAMRASEAGFDVVGFEVDDGRAARLAAGDSYIEDVPDEVLRAAIDRGYLPTSDPAALTGFDVAVISVPTPLRDSLPDLSSIEGAVELVADHLKPGALVVLESTTYPGTTDELVGGGLQRRTGMVPGRDFLLGYSPERIDPGSGSYGLANTPKVVAGVDQHSTDAVAAFFGAFVDELVPVSSCATAELTKLIENTFRHVNIALVNEIAMFAADMEIDVFEAIDAAATKPFGFMRFTPGPGVGGHCLPIDPTYLSWRVKHHLGENFRFIELANDINEHMPHYVVRRIQAALNRHRKAVNGARVVVIGLAYKPDVGDLREAPALTLIEQLTALGAEVVAVEPYAGEDHIAGADVVGDLGAAGLASCDIAVLVTDHAVLDYARLVTDAPLVLDTRNRLRDPSLPAATAEVEHL